MKTRRRHAPSQMAALACTVGCAIAAAHGCANENQLCNTAESNVYDAGPVDDSGDTGPGYVAVLGTYNSTTCPSVNPISVSPDNDGVVDLVATINNGTQE